MEEDGTLKKSKSKQGRIGSIYPDDTRQAILKLVDHTNAAILLSVGSTASEVLKKVPPHNFTVF